MTNLISISEEQKNRLRATIEENSIFLQQQWSLFEEPTKPQPVSPGIIIAEDCNFQLNLFQEKMFPKIFHHLEKVREGYRPEYVLYPTQTCDFLEFAANKKDANIRMALVDLQLSDKSSLETVRNLPKTIPIVLMSAHKKLLDEARKLAFPNVAKYMIKGDKDNNPFDENSPAFMELAQLITYSLATPILVN